MNKPPAEVEIYKDIDHRLVRFFRVLRDHGEESARRAHLMPYSQEEFDAAKTYPKGADDVEMALCDFVRWRQSFAGKERNWNYTTARTRGGMADSVKNWLTAVEMLPEMIDRLRRVQLTSQSAFDVISRFYHPDALIYCDPPRFRVKRSENKTIVSYREMTEAEHCRLASILRRCRSAVAVSGDDSFLYDELYRGWQKVGHVYAKHGAGRQRKFLELECLWIKPAGSISR